MILLGKTKKKHPGDLPHMVPDLPPTPPLNHKHFYFFSQILIVITSMLQSKLLLHTRTYPESFVEAQGDVTEYKS